jgi:glyceraldehyde-3-phosphate dehydrogenase/erythrose-4-phosphate dehydrogenase
MHGIFPHEIEHNDEGLLIDGQFVKCFHNDDPTELDWANYGAEYVADCTG